MKSVFTISGRQEQDTDRKQICIWMHCVFMAVLFLFVVIFVAVLFYLYSLSFLWETFEIIAAVLDFFVDVLHLIVIFCFSFFSQFLPLWSFHFFVTNFYLFQDLCEAVCCVVGLSLCIEFVSLCTCFASPCSLTILLVLILLVCLSFFVPL